MTPRFEALEGPLTAADLRAFHRAGRVPWYRRWWAVSTLVVLAAAALVAAAFFLAPLLSDGAGWIVLAAIAMWFAMLIGIWAWWLVGMLRRARLARFARASGFAFRDLAENVGRVGAGFPRGRRNLERGVVWGDAGGYEFCLGTNTVLAKDSSELTDIRRPFAFAELTLPSHVPHIVLKNRRSRILSLAGIGLGNGTRLKLEGDFDQTFSLMVPAGYERDALYIFTPDVMAAVLDVGSSAEIELVDDSLYLYLPARVPLWRAKTMRDLFTVMDVLDRRLSNQTERYVDERAPEGMATSLGARRILGDGVSALTYLTIGGIVVLSALFAAVGIFILPRLGF